MKPQAHDPIHMHLGAIHEAIKGIFERTKPKALIHEIGPLHLKLALCPQHIGSKSETLQLLMRLNQQQQPRRFVNLPTFNPHHTVLDHVETTDAMGACQTVGFSDQRNGIQPFAIDGNRITAFKLDLDLLGIVRGLIHGTGHRKDLFWWRHHRIFQGTSFNAAPEQVEIDRIRRFFAHGRRHAKSLAISDRFLSAHPPFTGWG